MNEFMNEATSNFKDAQKEIATLSLGDVMNIYNIINCLHLGIDPVDGIENVLSMLEKIIGRCETAAKCPRCGEFLFKSDLPQYDYVCFVCDENFYDCEV